MTTETEVAEEQNVQITMNDLMIMRAVIDASTQAGIFKAADLSAVGSVFDKVNGIVNDFIAKNPPPQPEGEAAAAE